MFVVNSIEIFTNWSLQATEDQMAATTSGSERSGLLLLLVCKQWSSQHLYFCCFLISKALAVPFTTSHKEIPQILNALDSPLVIPQSQDIWLLQPQLYLWFEPPMVLTWLWHQNVSPDDIELGGKHDGLYVVLYFAPRSL